MMSKFIEIKSLSDLKIRGEIFIKKGKTYYTWIEDYFYEYTDAIDVFKYTFYDDPTTIEWTIAYNKSYCGIFYKKFFTSLAEWRTKQIDSILDEE